jgi:hypothetical protein
MTASVWPRRLMTGLYLYLFLAQEFTPGAITKSMPGAAANHQERSTS